MIPGRRTTRRVFYCRKCARNCSGAWLEFTIFFASSYTHSVHHNSGLAEHEPHLHDLPKRVVYVGRDPTKTVRSIANEEEVIAALKAAFGDLLVVHRGKESLRDQLMLFARASVVVGAHGAGLANTMVVEPGACVVMLPMHPAVDHTFIHMASALDLEMDIVTDVTSYYYSTYGTLDEDRIQQIVDAAMRCWTARHGAVGGEEEDDGEKAKNVKEEL